ncbi:MAG: zinc-dependent alcohol dehydrogenase family protein [Planctomycetaceae bacterium]|nr:zinc-dependent alcohol dehydrogenase family protein [Planctomycetaceae bacterium]
MRCVSFTEPGEPADALRCAECEIPQPGRGEVLVKMIASPINPSDLMFVRGQYGVEPHPQQSPGFEGVGVVERSGGGLRGRLFTGRRVAVLNRQGGNWADYAVVPATQIIPLPSSLTDEEGATFFVNPATAWVMIREVLNVPRGGLVLQTAAASSLGRMIIRLCRTSGIRSVNVVRREEQIDELRKLGADNIVVFDAEQQEPERLAEEIRKAIGPEELRYAVDPIGGRSAEAVMATLSRGGRMLVYGTLSNQPIRMSGRILMTRGLRIDGFWLSQFMDTCRLPQKLRLVRRLTKLIRAGVLSTSVRANYSLEEITQAVQQAEQTPTGGKVLLKMS